MKAFSLLGSETGPDKNVESTENTDEEYEEERTCMKITRKIYPSTNVQDALNTVCKLLLKTA